MPAKDRKCSAPVQISAPKSIVAKVACQMRSTAVCVYLESGAMVSARGLADFNGCGFISKSLQRPKQTDVLLQQDTSL